MKVALAFLLVLCTLISISSGSRKGAKAKEVDLKKKLHQKIFHHHQHHHYHHQHHHPHHHRHHHHHHHPHHHHHHDNKNKHHHHHHHHRHHHYHNPFKHHLHRHHHPHNKHFHHHPHKHFLHQHHHPHKKQIQQHHKDLVHRHSNKRSDITHASVDLPNKLKLHVQIKDSQATKRPSLPDLLANLGHHLMKLGSSLTPKKSQVEVDVTSIGNVDKEGDVRNEVPEPKSSTVESPVIQDSSFATTPTDYQKKNVSLNEVEALLNHALDAASGDEVGSASSGNGAGEPSDAATTNAVTKTDEATTADRRNDTFPDPEISGPLESQETDASEKRRESNVTLEEIAAQSYQTENTDEQELTKNGRSDAEQDDQSHVRDDQSKNVESETNVSKTNVDYNIGDRHEEIHENGNQTESLNLTSQSVLEEPKISDTNSTLEDEESQNDKEVSESRAKESQNSINGESAAQDSTDEEEEKKTEVSGSGEEPSTEIKDNTEGQTAADDEVSQEASGAGQPSDKPSHQDEEENISVQSIDQNDIESTEGRQGRERESKPLVNESADSLDESIKPLPEENIDKQQRVVNVEGNQIMGKQSEESFQPGSTEGTEPKKGGPAFKDNKRIDQPDPNDSERPDSVESLDQSASSKDVKYGEDLDTQSTQPALNEPERSKPATNLEKIFQAQNERPTIQQDVTDDHSKQPNQQDHPAFNEIDNASGASQESIEDNNVTQDQDSQRELDGFGEGPKTPAILDELAENSSPSGGEPQVVNVEGSQLSDLHEDASQETGPEDAADEIPVYTLSSPIGDDSFASDESSLPTPTSSVTTSSVNFIDSGVNMSPGYSDSSSLSDGYNTYSATGASSQGVYNSLTQSAGLQRDMLDDPIQESLETAVDSKSS